MSVEKRGTLGRKALACTMAATLLGMSAACGPVDPNEASAGLGAENAPVGQLKTVSQELTAPSPTVTYSLYGKRPGYASARLYQNGAYDRPIVIAEPFNTAEADPNKGPRTAGELYNEMNGNPYLVGFGTGVLERLSALGYDIWLVQPYLTGDTLHEQAAEYAQALQKAYEYGGGAVRPIAFGFSLGGVVVRLATSRWANDYYFRADLGLAPALPVDLIVIGDSPLRGALLSYDLQHEVWKNKKHVEKNLHSCAAQQMLEAARYQKSDGAITWSDNNWYATYKAGWDFGFYYRDRYGTLQYRYCANEGIAIESYPWPAGVKRVAWTQGTFSTGTGQCHNDYRDRNGDYLLKDANGNTLRSDICPDVGVNTFGYGAHFARYDIDLWADKHLIHRNYTGNYKSFAELEAGSKHDSVITDHNVKGGFAGWDVDVEQIRHIGTFIPSRSALDAACTGCASSFTDYWSHNFNATHRAISNYTGRYGQSSIDWALGHINQAAGCVAYAGQACDGVDGDSCAEGKYTCEGTCSDASWTEYEVCGDWSDNDCNGQVDEGCGGGMCQTCQCNDGTCADYSGRCNDGTICPL